jgi:hypothetical protein
MSAPPYNTHHTGVNFNVSHTLPRPGLGRQPVKSSYDENPKLPPISWLPTLQLPSTVGGSHEHRNHNDHASGLHSSTPLYEDLYTPLSKRPNGTDWQGHQRRPPPSEAQDEDDREDSVIPMEE